MKNNIVFISNAIGGIKTFQDVLIKFITQKKIECTLIDKKPFKNHKKKLKYYKVNVLKEIYSTFIILKKIKDKSKGKNTIFIFSNPIIFIVYFLYIKFSFDKKKIFFFAHSHLTKKSTLLYLCTFLCGIFFLYTNKIFYVSKFTKEYWSKKYFFPRFAKNAIQYNSIELSKKIKPFNKKKFRIGFVGRADKEKGLRKFLDIAYENRYNFIFNVFSNSKINLNNNQKKFAHFFFNKDKSTIYKNMDLLLVTSPIENCPFSVLEAKSFGIPTLIYFTKGGIHEIIKNNHDGVIIKSKKKKINTINYINKIKFNYKFFSQNAFNNAKKYNANINITQLIGNELLK
jgi:glycosyltransferase involved in cell wall biosynthesis